MTLKKEAIHVDIPERLATDDRALALEPIHKSVLSQWVAGVMVRSSSSSYKFSGTEQLLRRCDLSFPIKPVQDRIDESQYNQWTREPGMTAAMKALQISSDFKAMTWGVFEEEVNEKLFFSLANDVMQLTVCNQGDLAHRKLPTEMGLSSEDLSELNREDIFEFLRQRLAINRDLQIDHNKNLQHKIFVGEAAFSLNHRRGVAGHTQTYFTSTPFTESSLALYVFGFNGAKERGFSDFGNLVNVINDSQINDKDIGDFNNGADLDLLLRVNGGLAWENVVLRHMITSVGGEGIDSPDFQRKYDQLMRRILGMGSDKLNLLLQAVMFNLKTKNGEVVRDNQGLVVKQNCRGGLTGDVAELARIADFDGEVGVWGEWGRSKEYIIFENER